ncbi:tumor necrosis factor receptor superfamily member 10B-like [Petromyzon marinus]|uniref:tumor necrosis factor receptor superfamily member 10B-like n=1 Tax=Petromyzon marinus TaxID=7757 RepID=UPI003F71A44A
MNSLSFGFLCVETRPGHHFPMAGVVLCLLAIIWHSDVFQALPLGHLDDRHQPVRSNYYMWYDNLTGRPIPCWSCTAGEYVTLHCKEGAPESTECAACPEGTYTDMPNGLESCLLCAKCHNFNHHYMEAPCKPYSNTLCRCQGRMYKDGDVCVHCDSGYERRESVDGEHCRKCPTGSFSFPSRGQDTCQSHTNCSALGQTLESAGTHYSDATCAPVPTTAPPVNTPPKDMGTTSGPHSRATDVVTISSVFPAIQHSSFSADEPTKPSDTGYTSQVNVIIALVTVILVIILACLVLHYSKSIRRRIVTATLSREEKDIFLQLSDRLGLQWQRLARSLGSITEVDIETISTNHKSLPEKTYMVLIKWKQNSGKSATLRELARALDSMDRRDLVELISSKIPNEMSMGSRAVLL